MDLNDDAVHSEQETEEKWSLHQHKKQHNISPSESER
jgi:hypothetical protein